MKRYSALLLVVVMLFSMVACKRTENAPASMDSSASMQTPSSSESITPSVPMSGATQPPTTQGEEAGNPPATQTTNPPATQIPVTSTTNPPVTQPTVTTHTHSWKVANYQQAATCIICGEISGLPLTPGFVANNMQCSAQFNVPYTYTTRCKEDESRTTTGTVTFSDYDVYVSSDKHEAREGFVWQAVTMTMEFGDKNANDYGIMIYRGQWDYYLVDLDTDGYMDTLDYDTFPVNYNGKEYECWVDIEKISSGWSYLRDIWHFNVRYYFCVPQGYDGVVLGVYDTISGFTRSDGQKLSDYYKENWPMMRLPSAIAQQDTQPDTTGKKWIFSDSDVNHITGTNGTDTITINVGHPELPDNYIEGTLEIERSEFCCDGEWVFYREYCYYERSKDPTTSTPGGAAGDSEGGGWHRGSSEYYMVKFDGSNKVKVGTAYNWIDGFDGPVRTMELIGVEKNNVYFLAAEGIHEAGNFQMYIYKVSITEDMYDLVEQGMMITELKGFQYDIEAESVENGWIYYRVDNSYNEQDPHHLRCKMRVDGTDDQFIEKIAVEYCEW